MPSRERPQKRITARSITSRLRLLAWETVGSVIVDITCWAPQLSQRNLRLLPAGKTPCHRAPLRETLPSFFQTPSPEGQKRPGEKRTHGLTLRAGKLTQPRKFKHTTGEPARRNRNKSRERQDKRLFNILNTLLSFSLATCFRCQEMHERLYESGSCAPQSCAILGVHPSYSGNRLSGDCSLLSLDASIDHG